MPQTHPQDPQSLWSSTHNGPDPTVDPVRWNTIWEERVKDNSLIRYGIELMMRSHGKECEILLTHIRYNTRFLVESQREVTSSYRGDTFNQKWKAISSSERRKHMLEGLVRSSINKPDSEADRIYCSDLTLDAMDGRDGEPFIQLVKAYIAPDASKLTPDTVRSYPHPSWAGEMKKEREKDKGSIRSLAWELIQLKRDRYICRFIDGTLESIKNFLKKSRSVSRI
ncbi:hypothetical protein BDQ17DRAFT_342530 [Cyathus striatus]|nr:hypothetical protein BDQ17DRAFT_342530 [Cyathus striatus]